MAYWIRVAVNSADLYAVEMVDPNGDFVVVSPWFATQGEAVGIAQDIVATKATLAAEAETRSTNDALDREVSINIAE